MKLLVSHPQSKTEACFLKTGYALPEQLPKMHLTLTLLCNHHARLRLTDHLLPFPDPESRLRSTRIQGSQLFSSGSSAFFVFFALSTWANNFVGVPWIWVHLVSSWLDFRLCNLSKDCPREEWSSPPGHKGAHDMQSLCLQVYWYNSNA